MSANIEHQLIGQIIATQDFHTIEKLKIDETFFLSNSQTGEVFRFIKNHFHNEVTYGSVPSWELIQSRFAGFPYVHSNDTLLTLCQEIRRYKVRAQLLTLVDDINTSVDVDPIAVMHSVREAMTTMASEHEVTSDLLLSNAIDQLFEEYQMIAEGKGIIGIPYPWEIMNDDTQGMKKGQFIVLYGAPKNLKTWVGLYIAVNAYLKGQRVLITTMEMSELEMFKRIACIIAKVDYEKFKSSKLDPATFKQVWEVLFAIRDESKLTDSKGSHRAAILVSNPRGSGGVATIQAKIKEFEPDLVMVDGMYLMKDDRQKTQTMDWKAISHVSQDLKKTASQFNIPIIGITQANRGADKDPKKANVTELAFAFAMAQDCDLCIRVTKQFDEAAHETELVLSIVAGRDSLLTGFVIHGCPASNFEFKRAIIGDVNGVQSDLREHKNGFSKRDSNGHNAPLILPTFSGKGR